MSEPKHTPGPWVIEEFSREDSADPDNAETAICAFADENGKEGASVAWVNRWAYGDDPATPESMANAYLIAAAPELLAACIGLIDALTGINAVDHPDLRGDVATARAAIAKAKGGAQ